MTNDAEEPKKKLHKGFAAMSLEKRREIARSGGAASGTNFKNDPERAAELGRKGGVVSGGNFRLDRARAAEAGRKGGAVRTKRQRGDGDT